MYFSWYSQCDKAREHWFHLFTSWYSTMKWRYNNLDLYFITMWISEQSVHICLLVYFTFTVETPLSGLISVEGHLNNRIHREKTNYRYLIFSIKEFAACTLADIFLHCTSNSRITTQFFIKIWRSQQRIWYWLFGRYFFVKPKNIKLSLH